MIDRISVPKTVTPERIQQLTADVRDGQRDLYVPLKISYKNQTLVPLLVQCIITWGVHPTPKVLHTELDSDLQSGPDAIARNSALLVALQFADSVVAADGADITLSVRPIVRAALELSSDLPQVRSGQTVGADRTVVAVDHSPGFEHPRGMYPTRALDEEARSLYAGAQGKDIVSMRGRPPLGHRALSIGASSAASWGDVYSEAGSALGELLFELLQNTDVHARHDERGNQLRKSVRLLHLRSINQTRTVLANSDPANVDLMMYYRRAQDRLGAESGDRMRFLVVSVIDSGPGLARTLLRRENIVAPSSPDHELRYLLRALRMTSQGSTQDPMRGLGLHRVQEFLTRLGGYARVRSGQFDLHRDFLRFPSGGAVVGDKTWFSGLIKPTPTDRLAGTSFTLLVPIPPYIQNTTEDGRR